MVVDSLGHGDFKTVQVVVDVVIVDGFYSPFIMWQINIFNSIIANSSPKDDVIL